ncbi:hypothetical protein SKAU_G00329310 [Synaphobranchus kaupii]|uniref:Uncharacterized protein n=1 Tax=Synaphobranchus kaupii TaxID=118154 RepID=A0A9Q1IIF8_SYNKA|nr:hypothetical protein SKAU_G00329310 [Synaphobranchus kaupii]
MQPGHSKGQAGPPSQNARAFAGQEHRTGSEYGAYKFPLLCREETFPKPFCSVPPNMSPAYHPPPPHGGGAREHAAVGPPSFRGPWDPSLARSVT